jgi:superfamily I DNA/RNA helicase
MEAIFRNQTHLQRVLVGDPNQQLYRWRGAGDTMNNFKEFEIGYLSESFRFNSEIARMANIILDRNNSPLRLIGSGTKTEINTKAILCRTNACVLDTFFNLVTKGLTEKVNISTDFKTSFSKMYHMEACYFNNEPKYPVSELAAITDSITLQEALSYSDELNNLWELRNKLTKSAGSLFKAQEHLKQHIATGSEKATLTISTIHGSKGLEWDNVTIANDFVSIPKGVEVEDSVASMWEDADLRCMLYVGITRAKVSIQLPYYLLDDFNIKEVFDKTSTLYY